MVVVLHDPTSVLPIAKALRLTLLSKETLPGPSSKTIAGFPPSNVKNWMLRGTNSISPLRWGCRYLASDMEPLKLEV